MDPQAGPNGTGSYSAPRSREERDGQREAPPGLDRLPPPMFPPGARHVHARRSSAPAGVEREHGGIPEDAFISPDDPIVREGDAEAGFGEDAFIDPDAPIVRTSPPRPPADYEDVLRSTGALLEEGVVTGIGDDAHLEEEDIRALEGFDDPDVEELSRALDRLADAVRGKGEGGLRTSADMSRFEATLRAYCVGYLAGRRGGDG